jgi:predicted secreted acid phosphatase
MPKFLNKLFNINPESKYASETESKTEPKTKSKYKKVVVFDLDETLGSFGQFGSFCMLLDDYYNDDNKAYGMFNELLDLYP